ncbi:SLC13 family permease [Nocardioides sp. URHA0032]|uniref:SLC13 family permease n=1 Tax=Nocardioides sp. URHA0032 TaxID=1380388 RepID=UPI000566827B|nr:SLC13 family permease [Nocardioides sp. URHA0032]
MPPLDAIPLAALLVLLVTAYVHPSARTELGVGLAAAAATLATGILDAGDVEAVLRHLGPVVLFLVTILVVADVCARAGLFAAVAARIRHASSGRPVRLFTGVFLLAAVVTSALSLDATVVLLTPVVVAAAAAAGTSVWPGSHACLRMANSASLLLPVSNLTNLLAMPHLDLTFAGFAVVMAPVLLAVLVVEYVVLRLLFRRELATPGEPADHGPDPALEPVPLVVVALMLAGFAVGSPLGVDPCWISAAAAVALVAWARHRGLVTPSQAGHAAHPAFAVFVLCLGIVVAALSTGFLGDLVADLVPGGTSYADLLAIAVLATVLANLLTNLSATLLLVPLVAPLGDTAVLAALLGLNIGSGLTYTGSLANLLWRRTLVRLDIRPSLGRLHRVSLVATPLSLLAAVTMLSAVAGN